MLVSGRFGLNIASMMKRTLLSIALATTTAMSVVACGSEPAEDASNVASSVVAEAASPSTSAEAAASSATSATSAASAVTSAETSPSVSPTASSAAEPAMPADVITKDTDPEFAALLSTNDNCSKALIDYAATNTGKTIQFDGYVANVVPSDNGGQRILVNPGIFDPAATPVGPSFQYSVASIADMHIAAGDESEVAIGRGGTFTATLGQFDSESCLLSLEPVSTVVN